MRTAMWGALLCACGSSTSPVPLDPSFAGTWYGASTVSLANVGPLPTVQSTLVVTVSGNTATAITCAGATVNATGSGDSLSWSGSVACPAQTVSGPWNCASVVFTYTGATANLSNDTLTLIATGTAVGCGTSYGATLSFTGTPTPPGRQQLSLSGTWHTYANGWNIEDLPAGWDGTSWNPWQGTVITATTSGDTTTFQQTDSSKTFWLNSLNVQTTGEGSALILSPYLQVNMGSSFLLEGFGYNCTVETADWEWDPVGVTSVDTVCGTQSWLVISGSGTLYTTAIGENCTAANVGFSMPGQFSWFLSSGAVPCGASWVQTWATSGEEPYDYGPWYFQGVDLQVSWTDGTAQDEGSMAQSGPVGMTYLGNATSLEVQGVTIQMEPSSLTAATAVGLGDDNPNWASNIASHPPPAASNIQCGSTVTFVAQSITPIERTIEPGFYGALSFERTGTITGCSVCGAGGCTPQPVAATETWGYAASP